MRRNLITVKTVMKMNINCLKTRLKQKNSAFFDKKKTKHVEKILKVSSVHQMIT